MKEIRFAILIGIDDYDQNPLDYCVKDVLNVKESFLTYCNVIEDNIYLIKSSYHEPSYDIYQSLLEIYKRIEGKFNADNDSIFFYFSGHGIKSRHSTTLALKDKSITLQEIFEKLFSLRPKFIFSLIDSCYSGVGISETIDKSAEEYLFQQNIAEACGYSIICASAFDKPAKEDELLQNGRFTGVFLEIIKNKLNYIKGVLTLNRIYQLIDEIFKDNPIFRQLPFAQNKGLSTYPLSFIDDKIAHLYYSSHYVADIKNFDWEIIKSEINEYCRIPSKLVVEIVRLFREIIRNSQQHGGATINKIEIKNDCVCIIDNSKSPFNIFDFSQRNINEGGGMITAKVIAAKFEKMFDYALETQDEFVVQRFQFKNKETESPCSMVIHRSEIKELNEHTLLIPKECKSFTIIIPQGYLDLSTISEFLIKLLQEIKQNNIPVLLKINDEDMLKNNFIEALKSLPELLNNYRTDLLPFIQNLTIE